MATTLIKLISAETILHNTRNEVSITLLLSNVGQGDASNVFIRNITFGNASRISPKAFPIFIGNLLSSNRGSLSVRFNDTGLSSNQEYLLTVLGTYEVDATIVEFAIEKYIIIPPVSDYPIDLLRARVDVQARSLSWNYTIYNDEPRDSQQFVAGFSLTIAAPVTVTGVPKDWFVETDNLTFVAWFSVDKSIPYRSHISPGKSLRGFQLKSSIANSETTPYILSSWRHDTDESGAIVTDYVATPHRIL